MMSVLPKTAVKWVAIMLYCSFLRVLFLAILNTARGYAQDYKAEAGAVRS